MFCVTPFAGVWIEIDIMVLLQKSDMSLPSRECGLKSFEIETFLKELESLPSRECGLKLSVVTSIPGSTQSVTPFAGVWIEIERVVRGKRAGWSLPSRECGLKLKILAFAVFFAMSLPSRECGLKSRLLYRVLVANFVTPFAGVWIEIPVSGKCGIFSGVTPFAGVWIEIEKKMKETPEQISHSLRGSVD